MNPKFSLGIATGEFMRRVLERHGRFTVGYRWNYRSRIVRTPFPPHLRLDGKPFRDFSDPVLLNPEPWPKTTHFYPGDHEACRCAVRPRLVNLAGRRV